VIDAFGRDRLLSFDRNEVTGAPTVEVAHEALLEHWDRLAGWIEEGKEDVLRNARLLAAAAEWHDSGCDAAYLLSGGRLDAYEQWADGGAMTLAQPERDYLETSIAHRDTVALAETERVAREASATRRAMRNAWGLVAMVLAVVMVGSYLIWTAVRPEGPTVAFIHAGEHAGGISTMLTSGLEQADRDFDIEILDVPVVLEPAESLRRLASDGVDMIIGEINIATYFAEVAPEFPDVQFVMLDLWREAFGSVPENVASIVFRDADAAYLVGVACARASRTGRTGFIGGVQNAYMEGWLSAYEAGVRSVDSEMEVMVSWVAEGRGDIEIGSSEGWNDPAAAYDAATNLYDLGADVVFIAASGSADGAMQAAVDFTDRTGEHVWIVGADADEALINEPPVRGHVLGSLLKHFDKAMYEAIRMYLDKSLPLETELGLVDGAVGVTVSSGKASEMVGDLTTVEDTVARGDITMPVWSTTPTSWRSEPDHRIVVTFDGEDCSFDRVPHLVEGEIVSFDVHNETSQPVGIAFGLVPSGLTHEELAASPGGGPDLGVRPTGFWQLPPLSTYEFRTSFLAGEYGAGAASCWPLDGSAPLVSQLMPVRAS
ncbi:MAG: BMP family ABC transporter substrate-binding protein, partial [Actinomycetota bacterium]